MDNGVRDDRSNWLVAPPTPHRAVPPELHVLHTAMRAGLQITRLAALSQPRSCDLRNARPTHCLCGHSGLWSIWLCQYWQYRTSNTHRTELIDNSLMVDQIKGRAEIILSDPSLLHTPQCTLQCMGHSQKCITGTHTFTISKLFGWKHTTVFHKSFELWKPVTNWQQKRTVDPSK